MPHVTIKTHGEQTPPRDRRRVAVGVGVGLLAVGAALGFGELAAGLLRATSPVVTVGDALVDNSPAFLMKWAIEIFGTADKAVLITGVLVVLVLVGAVLGVVALRRPLVGYAGLVLFAAAGLAAVALRRTDDLGAAAAVVVGAGAGAVALALLLRSARHTLEPWGGKGEAETPADTEGAAPAQDSAPTVPEPGPDRGPGRRGFVFTAAGVLAASGSAGALGRWLPSLTGGAGSRAELALPAPAAPLPALPSGTDLGVPGLEPFTTPNPDFYRIDTALTIPRLDSTQWTLRVHGLVDRPFEIDMDELLSRELVEADITLVCVSNQVGGDLISNTRWLGFPLADLLREAGVHSGADQILSTSSDGWTCGTPTEVVMDGRDSLLAVGMGGEPLPHVNGYPARMVVPGLYGFVSATKWVTDIKLTRFADEQAYWAQRGWGVRAPVKTMSRIDVPAPLGRVESGEVVLAGIAWAQHRGIDAVEVRVDDGEWWEAELAEVPGIDTWVQWVTETTVDPGNHAVEVRATDSTGFTQPSERVEPVPDGATGWHRIRFTAT
ncbi:molybdopterin-dependent oxidoreductase [Nocardiopsis valliformis]|uniref:molybdopterin-dependent oxidoreductase n=1 Tax=Nocardiopsis valliformis TaxID=239974 RepID=UPI00058468BD|nr:molybdopterin-dependent oxidoreductase [Nocardiopsis valliformis]